MEGKMNLRNLKNSINRELGKILVIMGMSIIFLGFIIKSSSLGPVILFIAVLMKENNRKYPPNSLPKGSAYDRTFLNLSTPVHSKPRLFIVSQTCFLKIFNINQKGYKNE
jgi:hypothetical protein